MTPPSSRKRPHCHTCGAPMAGHKRDRGRTVCPDFSSKSDSPVVPSSLFAPSSVSLPASPPLTPPRTSTHRSSSRGYSLVESFDMPEHGPWHRRNPNWVSATPTPGDPSYSNHPPPPSVGSLVPTVLVDEDGHTIRGSSRDREEEWDEDDDRFSVTSWSPSNAPSRCADEKPLVSIYGAKQHEIPHLREKAVRRGAHAGFVHVPVKKSRWARKPAREGSWWLIMGKDQEVVDRIVHSQQKTVLELAGKDAVENSRIVTFLQLVAAGFVGGCVAVYGLSLL